MTSLDKNIIEKEATISRLNKVLNGNRDGYILSNIEEKSMAREMQDLSEEVAILKQNN